MIKGEGKYEVKSQPTVFEKIRIIIRLFIQSLPEQSGILFFHIFCLH